jgi:hypothetical protein
MATAERLPLGPRECSCSHTQTAHAALGAHECLRPNCGCESFAATPPPRRLRRPREPRQVPTWHDRKEAADL